MVVFDARRSLMIGDHLVYMWWVWPILLPSVCGGFGLTGARVN